MHLGLLSVKDLTEVLKKKPSHVEVVLTGRHAPKKVTDMADLVTEMKEVKHPYTRGVQARRGIEF